MFMFTHDRIRELREALGLNLREFGKLVGVSEATASRWETEEKGKRRHPGFQRMLRLNEIASKNGVRFAAAPSQRRREPQPA